jgi:hypothetical protein
MTVRMVVMVLDVLEASGYHDASNPTYLQFEWGSLLASVELYSHQPKSGDPTGLCDLFHGYSV